MEDPETVRAVFYGLGSDGTVGANKNTIKILGAREGTFAQGYFVYDSKKSGSRTVSHLRFGPKPITAPYLVSKAGFIGCHHWSILEQVDVLRYARPGTVLLLNAPYPPDEVFSRLPGTVQQRIIDLGVELYDIDASAVARSAGWGTAPTRCCRPATSRSAGSAPRRRRSRRSRSPSARPTRARVSRSWPATRPPSTPRSRHLHQVEVPDRRWATPP